MTDSKPSALRPPPIVEIALPVFSKPATVRDTADPTSVSGLAAARSAAVAAPEVTTPAPMRRVSSGTLRAAAFTPGLSPRDHGAVLVLIARDPNTLYAGWQVPGRFEPLELCVYDVTDLDAGAPPATAYSADVHPAAEGGRFVPLPGARARRFVAELVDTAGGGRSILLRSNSALLPGDPNAMPPADVRIVAPARRVRRVDGGFVPAGVTTPSTLHGGAGFALVEIAVAPAAAAPVAGYAADGTFDGRLVDGVPAGAAFAEAVRAEMSAGAGPAQPALRASPVRPHDARAPMGSSWAVRP